MHCTVGNRAYCVWRPSLPPPLLVAIHFYYHIVPYGHAHGWRAPSCCGHRPCHAGDMYIVVQAVPGSYLKRDQKIEGQSQKRKSFSK